jgi:hypothetical protein
LAGKKIMAKYALIAMAFILLREVSVKIGVVSHNNRTTAKSAQASGS